MGEAMIERPILFSAPMVRAILEGRKTQTRRVVKLPITATKDLGDEEYDGPQQFFVENGKIRTPLRYGSREVLSPHGGPGDRLWVREAWATLSFAPYGAHEIAELAYRADDARHHRHVTLTQEQFDPYIGRRFRSGWRPSIHMPRWASRLTLDVLSVRVERLQDISEEDAKAEGVEPEDVPPGFLDSRNLDPTTYRGAFAALWSVINGPESWDLNPWVWVVEFKRAQSAARAA